MSCHSVEHLPICIRFVDSECNIREEFIAFIKLGRVRAVDVSDAIIKSLENIGLSLSNLRGQGYDGASTMSGARGGVQARICEKQPKAIYTHCAGHSLNLAIGNSCLVPAIRNCIDRVKYSQLILCYHWHTLSISFLLNITISLCNTLHTQFQFESSLLFKLMF